jgi:hypothetical protein
VFPLPSYTNFWIDQTGLVVRGDWVVKTSVPATAPNAVLFTGILKVVLLTTVAVEVPFTAVQLPVPPLMVTNGVALAANPCPALTVNTTGLALVADAIEIDGDVGWMELALQT